MTNTEPIHVHTSHVKSSFYVLLLLIPSLVFAFVLAVITSQNRPHRAAIADSNVLGQEYQKRKIKIGDRELTVRIADNEVTRQRGLSGVTNLAPDEGMLFIFKNKDNHRFWMKDMFIPLDIIWINDNKVTQIHEEVPPPAFGTPDVRLPLYIPNDKINYVLEVNAGFSKSNNIAAGSIFEFVTAP
jgi:uncharacterized protein